MITRLYIEFADPADFDTVDAHSSTEYEPGEVLQRKIEALADILDCTPEEAERALFQRL